MSTNVQIWNPNGNNMETDTQYVGDSQRQNGAQQNQEFNSILANKLFYQLTVYIYGLFKAMAQKGYTTSDSNVSQLVSTCMDILTWKDLGLQTVSYGASVVFDCSQASVFQLTLAGNTTISVPNGRAGQMITVIINSGTGGGWSVTWPSNVVSAGIPDTSDSGVNNVQTFVCDANGYFRPIGPMSQS